MREIGFVAALVLIICGFLYFSLKPAGVATTEQDKYTSAVNAAKGVSQVVDAANRRKWAAGLQMKALDNSMDNPAYSVGGENSEILVVTANSLRNSICTLFANGEHGIAASDEGFTEVICRDRTTGTEYEIPLTPSR